MIDRLINGVVLAELGGYGDGPYAAQHGAGAALVMLGTYIVDGRERVPYPPAFVFKPGRANYAGYLAEHIAAARASGALVGVSVVSVDLADSVDFLQAAEEAGADCVSLCAHSTMQMFVSAGVSSALCRRENWPSLQQWARALGQAVRIPLIFKIGTRDTSDTLGAVEVLAAAGVSIIHANVFGAAFPAGAEIIGQLKRRCVCLIAGGGVHTVADARQLRTAGADAVAIGTAAMGNAGLCRRIQGALREGADTPG